MTDFLGVGDVLAVKTSTGITEKLIDIGAVLRGEPTYANHVAVMHHYTDGVPWGLEGRPGGVGWVDLRRYIVDPHTVMNFHQPKTKDQRDEIGQLAPKMLGTKYDWEAIADEALLAFHLPSLFTRDWKGQGVPGHVICSSFAAWLYTHVGLPCPTADPTYLVTPADWVEFILSNGWQ